MFVHVPYLLGLSELSCRKSSSLVPSRCFYQGSGQRGVVRRCGAANSARTKTLRHLFTFTFRVNFSRQLIPIKKLRDFNLFIFATFSPKNFLSPKNFPSPKKFLSPKLFQSPDHRNSKSQKISKSKKFSKSKNFSKFRRSNFP